MFKSVFKSGIKLGIKSGLQEIVTAQKYQVTVSSEQGQRTWDWGQKTEDRELRPDVASQSCQIGLGVCVLIKAR